VKQAQPAPQPWQPPQRSQVTVHTLGPEKPVALTQPGVEERPSRDVSRRDAERLKAQQRREERAQRREERRKQMAERRRPDELRRVKQKPAAEPSLREVVGDEDEGQPPVARPRGFFGGFFRSPSDDDSGWR
jgi:hypothetical protein